MIDQTFFNQPVKRRGTGCVKWDAMPADDVIPMWVADMDFAVAPAIQKAIKDRAAHPVFGYTLVPDSYYERSSSGSNVATDGRSSATGSFTRRVWCLPHRPPSRP